MKYLPGLLEAPLDRASTEPLQRQLYRRIKEGIAGAHLPAGLHLPATRVLAQMLAVSRNTVSMAYEHLLAEGYVLADRQGTVVAALRARPSIDVQAAPSESSNNRRAARALA